MRVYLHSDNRYAKLPRSTQTESISAAEDKIEQPVGAVGGGTEAYQTQLKLCIHEVGNNFHTPRAGLDPDSDLMLKNSTTHSLCPKDLLGAGAIL